jgi:hypothetical protein
MSTPLESTFSPTFSRKISKKIMKIFQKKMSQKWPKTPISAHYRLPNPKKPHFPSSISTPMIQGRFF